MIGNYQYWITARVGNDGAGQVTAHASADYAEGRGASVAVALSPEEAAKAVAELQALLESKLAELQLKATTGAAEVLVVAAKRGELGGAQ